MEVAVNFLVERLLEVGRENVELIVGVQDDVNNLVADLRELKAFLKDASKIDRDTEGWREAVKDVRIVVYKAEDAIDKFLVEAKKHQDLHVTVQWADVPYWRSVKNVAKELKSIGSRVKELRVKYDDILKAIRTENPSNTSGQPREQNLSEDDDVVGFDEEAKTVIGRLIEGSKELEAVPILGMAGLGKSTLANKVYKDSTTTYEFFNCIWVSVSRNKKRDILLSILVTHFKKQLSSLEHMNDDQLTTEIRTCIEKGGKCLIMLDDVWDTEVMDFIKHVFPKNNKGHRIMMTTREEGVACYFNENIHRLKFLNNDESWLLLKKKVFRKETCSSEFEEPGTEIARKCSGLPLAIVVIAGALIGKTTKREWQIVHQTIGERLISRDDPRSCLGFVKMSYDLLSYDTKTCFLYCATFPKGFEIPAWKLVRLWIAEGFILYDKNLTLEEKAEDCLNNLTKKNLVMAMKRTSNGQVKTCRVHDMLFDFCKKEASEEYLFQEISPGRDHSAMIIQDSSVYRRLCVESSSLKEFLSSISSKQSLELVRSFLCFSLVQTDIPPASVKTIHKAFPMIRVLDVESMKFLFTRDFYQLMHLKYVAFSGDFNSLPEVFATKLWNLETIIIKTTASDNNPFVIKADIWKMLRLRHLHTNVAAILPAPGAPTGKDCSIQTLSAIAPESCTKEIFSRARYLRKLGIRGNVRSLLDTNTVGQSNLAELKRLERLEKLKIIHNNQKGTNTGKIIVLPKLVFIFSNNLKQLTFSGTELEWSEMSKLGQLEFLEVLKLKENAFKGDFWEMDNGGFTSLLVLLIERTDLKTWRASKNSFTNLKRLLLRSCEDLVEIPDSLADIDNLQEMRLENCHKTAVKLARGIETKRHDIQKKTKEEQERSADENKLDRPTSFSVAFKVSVFPPDSDA